MVLSLISKLNIVGISVFAPFSPSAQALNGACLILNVDALAVDVFFKVTLQEKR
jgi:hypothetical protein